ncbi:MAG TPA: hypothetical protein VIH26_01515 [Anaerolineales bacterium]
MADLPWRVRQAVGFHWDRAQSYQRLLYRVGGLLVLSAGFHFLVMIATRGLVEGSTSWRKPVLFGEAFGLTAITIGWVMTYLPKRRAIGWALAGGLAVSTSYEVVWVSVQQWRGVPSHFNYSTGFDTAAFNTAGTMIFLAALAALIVTGWSLFSLSGPASLRLAIRSGLLLLLAGQAFGFAIIENGNSKVFDPQTGEYLPEAVEQAATFGDAGSMKVPHALSVHAIQILPALAGLLSLSTWSERRRWWTVLAAAVAYAGLVAVSASQTFRGLALFDLAPPAAVLFGTAAAGLIGAYAAAVFGSRTRSV